MPITAKQKEVLDQVFDLMHEHFESFVMVFDTTDAENDNLHYTNGQFSGGHAAAVGMMRLFTARIEGQYTGTWKLKDDEQDQPPKDSA